MVTPTVTLILRENPTCTAHPPARLRGCALHTLRGDRLRLPRLRRDFECVKAVSNRAPKRHRKWGHIGVVVERDRTW